MRADTRKKKEQILDKAIEYFSKHGIADTKIEDITSAAGIGKGTLYLYFKSKRDLLLECMWRLSRIMIPEAVWEDIRKETDYSQRSKKRLVAFLKAYPTFCGILNLVHQNLHSSTDQRLAKEAHDIYQMLAGPLIKDLRWAVGHGQVRKIDEKVFPFVMVGIAEALSDLMRTDPHYSAEQLADTAWGFVLDGIRSPAEANAQDAEPLWWGVRDSAGHEARIHGICFNRKQYLAGSVGMGELQMPVQNIIALTTDERNGSSFVTVVSKNGGSVALAVNGNTVLRGETEFGSYEVPLRDVISVTLIPPDEADQGAS
jgi:AcrR family transcriptional regulator